MKQILGLALFALSASAFAAEPAPSTLLCKGKDGIFRVMFSPNQTPVLIDIRNGGDVIHTTAAPNGAFQLVEEAFGDGETTIVFRTLRGRTVMLASDVDESGKPFTERFSYR